MRFDRRIWCFALRKRMVPTMCSNGPMSGVGQSRRFGRRPMTSGLPPTTDIVRPARLVRFVPILLQKSKIERPEKTRQSGHWTSLPAASLSNATTEVRDRFGMKRHGPFTSPRAKRISGSRNFRSPHAELNDECRFSGVKPKQRGQGRTVAFDPTRAWAG